MTVTITCGFVIYGQLRAFPFRQAAVASPFSAAVRRWADPSLHRSLHFLARASAADLAIWQEATSVCQLRHKYIYKAEEAFMVTMPGARDVS